jgi:hypothetical protein
MLNHVVKGKAPPLRFLNPECLLALVLLSKVSRRYSKKKIISKTTGIIDRNHPTIFHTSKSARSGRQGEGNAKTTDIDYFTAVRTNGFGEPGGRIILPPGFGRPGRRIE